MMKNSRTKNAVLILFSSSVRQIITLIVTFIIRTLFIRTLGSEYLGLNGLFTNILSLLALSELGIGTAITFYLYKPIEDGDVERIKTLMGFYKICYRFVGFAILFVGLIITPFLPYVVNFDTELSVNLYVIYILYLINTASSYLLFAYKQSFLLANQQQYKVERISTVFCLIQFVLDFFNIAILRNFYAYLIGDILAILIKNVMISVAADKEYQFLKEKNFAKITTEELRRFFKDIFSVSVFKIGSQLFNATDNIIISVMLGTTIVGYYSNYYLLISYATLFFGMIMKAFTAGIGNVSASESEEKKFLVYKRIDFLMFVIATVASVCMCQLFNSFMNIWVGAVDEKYILSQIVVFILSFDFYINCSCQTPNTFRETSGNFKSGQWLQLIGGVVNIGLSFLLGHFWGLQGIFLATIVTKLIITVTPFLWKIARDVFGQSSISIVFDYYKKLIVRTIIVLLCWAACSSFHMTNILGLFIEAVISITISAGVIFVVYRKTDEFHYFIEKIKAIIVKRKI